MVYNRCYLILLYIAYIRSSYIACNALIIYLTCLSYIHPRNALIIYLTCLSYIHTRNALIIYIACLSYDEIDGGQKDCSNSGGVSRLFMYSSAAHISLRQGLHHFQQVTYIHTLIIACKANSATLL